LDQLDKASRDFEKLKKQRKEAGINQKLGMTLTFQGEPGFDLKFESLESSRAGIELLVVWRPGFSTGTARSANNALTLIAHDRL
jgi:hypothetical protein